MTTCGIYKITNNLTNKCYIGQSFHVEDRLNRHKQCPKTYSHYPLYQDIRELGLNCFSFEIIEECSPDQLNEREIYWIDYYNSFENGYNQTKGGTTSGHPMKISEEALSEIIDLLLHSNLTQTEIANMFNVGNDTISEINQGKSRYNPNLTYPLRDNQKRKHNPSFCKICGVQIYHTSTYCINCFNKKRGAAQRKVPSDYIPSREELKSLLREMPFTQIGKKYGVTDNSVRKWCDKYGLPRTKKEIKTISNEAWELI